MSEISDVAGNAADGIVRGVVDQSLFSGAYTSVEDTETVFAFNLDTSTGTIDFTDYTVQCTSGVANSFLPWSSDAQFSAGDALYIASDESVTEIRFTIDTPGVWVGGGLDILDSTDGATPNRTLTGVSDASNGFRNGPGTYVITWTDPAIPRVAWSPVPGFIAARKWIVIRPSGYISSTTSPKMSMTYCLNLGTDFEVKTAVYNATLSDGTFAAGTNVVYKVGEADLFSFPAAGLGLDLMIHRKATNTRNVTLEYYSTSGTWLPFTGVDDPSDWMKNGPTTLGVDPPELFHVRWVKPANWDIMPLTIDLDPGGLTPLTGAFMRARVSSVSNYAPQVAPLARGRARSLDASGAVIHLETAVYSALTFEVGVPCLSNTTVQLLNINTGAAVTAVIPSLTYSSCNLPLERIVFSAPLSIGAGDALLVTWQSGGVLQDVELVLQ